MSNAVLNKHDDDSIPKKNLVLYGNPNTGRGDDGDDDDDDDDGRTKWSPTDWGQSTLAGPPVISNWNQVGDDSNHPQSGLFSSTGRQSTPRSRTKSIYGTPSTLRKLSQLPGERSQADGGEVYQNPLRQDEEEEEEGGKKRDEDVDEDADTDDLVARNTRINATAPLPPAAAAGKRKKRKGGR